MYIDSIQVIAAYFPFDSVHFSSRLFAIRGRNERPLSIVGGKRIWWSDCFLLSSWPFVLYGKLLTILGSTLFVLD